jgi:hypothetical protein
MQSMLTKDGKQGEHSQKSFQALDDFFAAIDVRDAQGKARNQ